MKKPNDISELILWGFMVVFSIVLIVMGRMEGAIGLVGLAIMWWYQKRAR